MCLPEARKEMNLFLAKIAISCLWVFDVVAMNNSLCIENGKEGSLHPFILSRKLKQPYYHTAVLLHLSASHARKSSLHSEFQDRVKNVNGI